MSELPPIPGFTKLTGPPYVGITCAVFLFGLLTLQFYNYNIKYRHDYLLLKIAVFATFILELVSTVMTVADGYHWFVHGFGEPNVLAGFFLSNFDTPIMGSLVAVISQSAYCWRIYRLSGLRVLPIVILLVVLGSEFSYFAGGIFNQTLVDIANWKSTSTRLAIVWAVGNVVSDNLIAILMIYLLVNNTSLRGASWLGRMVRLILESNVLSALVSVLLASFTFIDSIKPPKTSMFLAPGYVLSKMYSNCLLIMLNNRMYAGDVGEESADFGMGGHAVPPSAEIRTDLRKGYGYQRDIGSLGWRFGNDVRRILGEAFGAGGQILRGLMEASSWYKPGGKCCRFQNTHSRLVL